MNQRQQPVRPQWETAPSAQASALSSRLMGVHPTGPGHRLAEQLLAAQDDPLPEALAALSEDEQEVSADPPNKLLTKLYERDRNSQYLHRLWDRAAYQAHASRRAMTPSVGARAAAHRTTPTRSPANG